MNTLSVHTLAACFEILAPARVASNVSGFELENVSSSSLSAAFISFARANAALVRSRSSVTGFFFFSLFTSLVNASFSSSSAALVASAFAAAARAAFVASPGNAQYRVGCAHLFLSHNRSRHVWVNSMVGVLPLVFYLV